MIPPWHTDLAAEAWPTHLEGCVCSQLLQTLPRRQTADKVETP